MRKINLPFLLQGFDIDGSSVYSVESEILLKYFYDE